MVAKFGLGKNPIRTMLYILVLTGLIGMLFTIREVAWLLIGGMFLYMAMMPAIESAEQTVIQGVVPYKRQGRVFGFAMAIESVAAPITAFLIAPLAEFIIIPYMRTTEARSSWSWLLGTGDARGIALTFFMAGAILVVAALAAFRTKTYRQLSDHFLKKAPS
jgi:DHA3 family multidrug efflux protein-like MFS transporter